jgi:hypothetical protein
MAKTKKSTKEVKPAKSKSLKRPNRGKKHGRRWAQKLEGSILNMRRPIISRSMTSADNKEE